MVLHTDILQQSSCFRPCNHRLKSPLFSHLLLLNFYLSIASFSVRLQAVSGLLLLVSKGLRFVTLMYVMLIYIYRMYPSSVSIIPKTLLICIIEHTFFHPIFFLIPSYMILSNFSSLHLCPLWFLIVAFVFFFFKLSSNLW